MALKKTSSKKPAAKKRTYSKRVEITEEAINEIIGRLLEGEGVRDICKAEHLPSAASFFKFLNEDEAAKDQYARARDAFYDSMAIECLDIADGVGGWCLKEVPDRKLSVDTRKWFLAKRASKSYGDKIDHVSSDKSMTQTTIDVSKLSSDVIEQFLALKKETDNECKSD